MDVSNRLELVETRLNGLYDDFGILGTIHHLLQISEFGWFDHENGVVVENLCRMMNRHSPIIE